MVSTNYHIEFSGAKHMDYAMIKKRSRKKKKTPYYGIISTAFAFDSTSIRKREKS